MILASDIENALWGAKALGRHGYGSHATVYARIKRGAEK